MSRICTHMGNYFDFADMQNSVIDIKDIAYALSNTCRYGGHCNKYYSVAQHSVLVSYMVPEEDALEGLMHDSSEAFLGDVPTPLKNLLPDFQKLEFELEEIIAQRFGFRYPFPESVHRADKMLLAAEQRDLMPNYDDAKKWHESIGLVPWADTVIPWEKNYVAEQMFLWRFDELMEDRRLRSSRMGLR